jgi:hypothetical protein
MPRLPLNLALLKGCAIAALLQRRVLGKAVVLPGGG